jgi:hypothetical protein
MQEEYENNEEENEDESDASFKPYEELLETRKVSLQDIRQHMTGPVISTMIHVVLLAFLGTIIVFKAPEKSKEIQVEMKTMEIKEVPPPPKPPEPPEPVEVESDIEIERPDVVTENVEVTVEDVAVQNTAVEIELPNVLNVKPTNSALVMPALFSGRSGSGRQAALKSHGGGSRTENAVLRGLRWLKDHQNTDGSWGNHSRNNFPAYTGMALLAFLAHGETPASHEFGLTVKKAIQKLIEFEGPEVNKVPGGYRHAIVMYALSEAYALTQMPALQDIVNKGLKKIIDGMNAQGSFTYNYDLAKKETGMARSDLSVAGWNYQALKAAFAAGCTTEGLEEAIDRAINIGLKKTHYNPLNKMFCYGTAPHTPETTMTAVGTLCLQLFGEGKSSEAQGGMSTLGQPNLFWIDWHKSPSGKPTHDWALYQWYYQTQAMFQGHSGKGNEWKRWNKMFTTTLIKEQKKDGRWVTPASEHQQGGGEAQFKELDLPVYATSLCCLMLEVYYRYLPTFKVAKLPHETKSSNEKNGDDEDDIGFELDNIL